MLKADTIFGFGAGAFEGVIVGVGKGFWRVGAGFLDIVTFPCRPLLGTTVTIFRSIRFETPRRPR